MPEKRQPVSAGCRFSAACPPLAPTPQTHCGSGLAREGGVSVNICCPDTLPSRASPLPQGICGV
ncbi:hypothetical protein FHG55_15410 [Pseudomonas jessenii]|uniref:Uncharacterized protein n=1 Tax=Pseudomonas jessenii TaxID=77298 RepID=A0A5C4KW69_PSEJE|nr:hypothetical protein FHG55_15410 [Pseudomonas jessenii]